ncbi:hypothetical protein ACPA9J_31010 [Pseudomonas aeruginosa]
MMRNERDWVVVFDIPRIEAEIRRSASSPRRLEGAGGRRPAQGRQDSPVTRYIPVPKNPHGLNTSPDGKYFIANGKLSPTCTMIAIERPATCSPASWPTRATWWWASSELGLGPLHRHFHGRGNAYTTLFIDSQLVKWNLADAVRAYKGEKVDYIRQKLDVQYQPGHIPRHPVRDQRSRRQVDRGAQQVLQGPLPAHRSAAPGERPVDRHFPARK